MRILGYNTPTHTLLLHYIYDTVSKLRSLKNADSSVSENVLFPLAVFFKHLVPPQDSINVSTHPAPHPCEAE